METKTCEHCGKSFLPAYRVTKAYWKKRRFCSEPCRAIGTKGQRRSTFGKERLTLEQRFWLKVKKGKGRQCWKWIGASDGQGYGYLAGTRGQSPIKAHRMSYQIHTGTIPEGMCICHKCDNPNCVNPAHLFLGTKADNNADKMTKGRDRKARGEQARSKLNNEQVLEIRRLGESGVTQQVIAAKFGVCQVHVSAILRRKLWKHL